MEGMEGPGRDGCACEAAAAGPTVSLAPWAVGGGQQDTGRVLRERGPSTEALLEARLSGRRMRRDPPPPGQLGLSRLPRLFFEERSPPQPQCWPSSPTAPPGATRAAATSFPPPPVAVPWWPFGPLQTSPSSRFPCSKPNSGLASRLPPSSPASVLPLIHQYT